MDQLSSEMDQEHQKQQHEQQQQPKQDQIDWRRSRVLELSSQGHSEREIVSILQISKTTVNRDLECLRQQAQDNLKTHIQETLPHEFQKSMSGINQVLKMAWSIATKQFADDKTKLQASQLITDCNKYKMDLTTNGVVITDAIKFVQTSKEKLTTMSNEKDNNDNNKENKEPDYDDNEDKVDQLEEKQEEETGEIDEETTNQVF